jgi:hypothetical protein
MLVLLGVWALFAIMEHSGIIGDDLLNTKQVVTIAALVGMLSHITATSMGSLNCKNDIIDLTLPVTTLERFTFIMLNSFVLGVVVPVFLLDIPAQQLLPTLCTMTLLHAALMVVACTVEPKFNDAELCEAYKTMDPVEVPQKMLTPGEYSKLTDAILSLNDFGGDAEEVEEAAKN